jgi:hypothetical protein
MKRIFSGLLLLVLLLLSARPVHAGNGALDGRLLIGQDFTLKSGETLDGDLVVIGGRATLEYGALVKGDIVVIGGSLRLDGRTAGSAVVIGGAVSVGGRASIDGDAVTLGGAFQRTDGARIGGNIVSSLPAPTLVLPTLAGRAASLAAPEPKYRFDWGPLGAAAALFLRALGLSAVGMLLAAFLRPQLDRVSQEMIAQPFAAGSIGLLTVFLAPIAVVVLVVTLILIPIAAAAVFLLVLAWLFGVVALGLELGERLTRALHRTWEPVFAAGLGTFVLTIGVGAANFVPCVGWLAPVLVGLIALGAAVITLFGTRSIFRTPPAITSDNPAVAGTSSG